LLGLFFEPEDGSDMAYSSAVSSDLIVKNAFYFYYKQITKGKLIVVKVQSCRASCILCMLGRQL
jgi:hypothetical protein